jgi:hypothetical protein
MTWCAGANDSRIVTARRSVRSPFESCPTSRAAPTTPHWSASFPDLDVDVPVIVGGVEDERATR